MPSATTNWKRICCPVDFSAESRHAMHEAAELARKLDAELVLLHVYQMPGIALPEGALLGGPEQMQRLLEAVERGLAEAKRDVLARGPVKVAVDTAIGLPWEEIGAFAKQGGFDLIVMATHGRSGLRHALLGSVAEKVVRTAPCPVLTIRPA